MKRYVALEGGDGVGKSTIAGAVAERLRTAGSEVVVVREPGGTEIGEAVRNLLLHGPDMEPWTEAMLFAAQRVELIAKVVRPALERGAIVLSDRTYYSSLAYQGGARGLGVDAVRKVNEAGLGDVVPDLVLVLVLDAERALAREDGADRISSTGTRLQTDAMTAYQGLAAKDPDRVKLVDAGASVPDVVDRVLGLMA